MSKSNTTNVDKSKIAFFDYIPSEILCKIANELTNPKDIVHFMQTYKHGTVIARDCVTAIKYEDTIKADFILKFENLKEAKVNTITTTNTDQYLELRFRQEINPDNWQYNLLEPHNIIIKNYTSNIPSEVMAYDLKRSSKIIIGMLKRRKNKKQKENVERQLIEKILIKRPLKIQLLKEITFNTNSNEVRNLIYNYAHEQNNTELISIFQ